MGSAITGNGRAMAGLGGPAGYGEIVQARSDDGSLRIDVSAVFETGLNHFGRVFAGTDLWVNTNGTFSFGAAFPAYPTLANAAVRTDLIAVYWGDVDTRLRGEGVESGMIYIDIDPGAEIVSVTWDNVGVYRRNTSAPNRFQLQLYDRDNGDYDIVMRYENLSWVKGTAEDDAGARVLLSSPRLLENLLPLPAGTSPAALDTTAGNTGTTGLWVFQMRDGQMVGAQVVEGVVRTGGDGADFLSGGEGHDTLEGRGGADTLDGGMGDDFLFGGPGTADLRDVIYGGGGSDMIEGGGGNDDLNGGYGNDTIFGGLGADTVVGNGGADVLSGGGGGDLMFGNDGNDTLNGGFGYDRMNGGAGADQFFHLGIADHGSDWIQDYSAAQGDRLLVGIAGATAAQFQVNYAHTASAAGVRSGTASVPEAFVIYRPTGQILWALVDGGDDASILVSIGGQVFDLIP